MFRLAIFSNTRKYVIESLGAAPIKAPTDDLVGQTDREEIARNQNKLNQRIHTKGILCLRY